MKWLRFLLLCSLGFASAHAQPETLAGDDFDSWGGGIGTRYSNGSSSGDSRSLFVMEPWVNLNLNVTNFFRISAGVSYRWVTGAHAPAATDSDLSDVAGILLLRFGSF